MFGLEKRDKTFYKGVKDDNVVDSRKESNMSGKSHLNTDHEAPTWSGQTTKFVHENVKVHSLKGTL